MTTHTQIYGNTFGEIALLDDSEEPRRNATIIVAENETEIICWDVNKCK